MQYDDDDDLTDTPMLGNKMGLTKTASNFLFVFQWRTNVSPPALLRRLPASSLTPSFPRLKPTPFIRSEMEVSKGVGVFWPLCV